MVVRIAAVHELHPSAVRSGHNAAAQGADEPVDGRGAEPLLDVGLVVAAAHHGEYLLVWLEELHRVVDDVVEVGDGLVLRPQAAVAPPRVVHALHQVEPVPENVNARLESERLVEVVLQHVPVALGAVEVNVGEQESHRGNFIRLEDALLAELPGAVLGQYSHTVSSGLPGSLSTWINVLAMPRRLKPASIRASMIRKRLALSVQWMSAA